MLHRSAPDRSAAIFEQDVGCARAAIFVFGNYNREHSRHGRFLICENYARRRLSFRIEKHQAAIGRHPQLAVARLEKVIHGGMRQTLVDSVVREGVTVKAGKAFARAEPEEAARVADDLVDDVVRQPVGHRVRLEGQSLGAYRRSAHEESRE